MKKNIVMAISALLIIGTLSYVAAWWLIDAVPVTSCSDSDGLDFSNQGHINVTGNYSGTYFDTCLDNSTVVEFACSADVYNTTGYALIINENCTNGCLNGRCL